MMSFLRGAANLTSQFSPLFSFHSLFLKFFPLQHLVISQIMTTFAPVIALFSYGFCELRALGAEVEEMTYILMAQPLTLLLAGKSRVGRRESYTHNGYRKSTRQSAERHPNHRIIHRERRM